MINLDTLRKSKGHVLALVDEKTGKYEPINADVVEVIRCKECKNLTHSPHKWYCPVNKRVVEREEFCCWAERKEE